MERRPYTDICQATPLWNLVPTRLRTRDGGKKHLEPCTFRKQLSGHPGILLLSVAGQQMLSPSPDSPWLWVESEGLMPHVVIVQMIITSLSLAHTFHLLVWPRQRGHSLLGVPHLYLTSVFRTYNDIIYHDKER